MEYAKLTLRIRKDVIERAKATAAAKATSVSKLVEGYLAEQASQTLQRDPATGKRINPGERYGIPVSPELWDDHIDFDKPVVNPDALDPDKIENEVERAALLRAQEKGFRW